MFKKNDKKVFIKMKDTMKRNIDIIILFIVIISFESLFLVDINIPENIKIIIIFAIYFTINRLLKKKFINVPVLGLLCFMYLIYKHGGFLEHNKENLRWLIGSIMNTAVLIILGLGFIYLHKKISRHLKEMQNNENKYKSLFNDIKDGIGLFEVDEENNTGHFLEVNDATCEMFGYNREEFLNLSPQDVVCDYELEKFYLNIQTLVEKAFSIFEYTLKTKDGREILCEVTANMITLNDKKAVMAVARDITERKKIEEKLKESEKDYRELIEFFPEAVYIHEYGKIIFANIEGAKLFGYEKPEEIKGKQILDFIHDDYLDLVRGRWKQIDMDNTLPRSEQKIVRKNGDILDVEALTIKYPYKEKSVFLSVARDITERKEAEENRRLLNEVLEYKRLRTEFFANLSHELRTPLNVLLGSLQLTKLHINNELVVDERKLNKYMNVMMQNCNRLLRLVNNLIDITKIDSGYFNIRLKNGDIVKVIEDITLSVADYIENKDINLIFDTDMEEKIMAFDPDKIERIVLNLLSNAVKFTESGGRISVNLYDKGEKIIIAVKDTGIGIPKDRLEIIFDRFRQVDESLTRKHEGSGIGLSLVKSLVKMHEGNIKVESEYGKGSEFIIELPIKILEVENLHYKNKSKDNIRESHIERINIEFSDIYSI